jgi:hypothetical protein
MYTGRVHLAFSNVYLVWVWCVCMTCGGQGSAVWATDVRASPPLQLRRRRQRLGSVPRDRERKEGRNMMGGGRQ